MNQPANILLLISDPLDASISIQRDLIALQDALRDLGAAAVFHTRAAEAGALQDHLERGDRPRYSILHYLGHGYKPPQSQDGYLIFENRGGSADHLDVTRLAMALAGAAAEFKLAVVSACHSESVAQSMFAVGVERVVAIEGDQNVYEAAAIAFCRLFYLSLLTGNSLDRAFDAGRRAVFTDETMRKLGDQKTQAEAAKFKLIPRPGADATQFRLAIAQGEADMQALPTLTKPPFDQRPLEFIGRNDDMRDLLATLNTHRAAVVLGVSGVGKTELAKQTARRMVERRRVEPDHVGFASLVNAKTAAEARGEIALALGLPPDGAPDNGALQRAVPRYRLVILDEAENVLAHDWHSFRQLLDALISSPGQPFVIVTSQTNPNTPKAPPVQVRRLPASDALRLFAVNADLDLEQFRRINREHLLEALGYVDRLPRAIELIARAWWRERGSDPDIVDLTSLLRQLRADRDRVMRDPDCPGEVKSVTVGVQFAYDRLSERSPEAAVLWTQLALFPGGVSKAALPKIFGDEAAALANEIEMQSLVESSFAHLPAPFGHLLELPTPFRLFALRHLPAGDEAAARQTIGEAVLRYYFDLPEEPHRGWVGLLDQSIREGGAAMGAFIARFNAELPSIESWLDWAYDRETAKDNRVRAPRLTALLKNLYVVTGELRNKRDRLDRALACALRHGDKEGEANVLKAMGDLQMRVDDLAGARASYEEALPIYREIEDRLGEANALQMLGNLAMAEEFPDEAEARLGEALKIHVTISDLLSIGADLGYLARVAMGREKFERAAISGECALTIFRAIEDRYGQALTLDTQGQSFLAIGMMEPALAAWWQAFIIFREIGDSSAERLEAIFGQVEAQIGEDEFGKLLAMLQNQAEEMRLAGVAEARKATGDDDLIREIAEQLRRLEGE
ncbi:MAG TPA: CHAT domain-containing protein [Blastocatellia bacterium]|nr:CHAT domain-containing protein [Blastocatellia bacterium]